MSQLTRREILREAAVLAGVLGASTAWAREAIAAELETAASGAVTGTVTVWQHLGSTVYTKSYDALQKAFTKANPGVKIKNTNIPYGQFESKSLVAFTSGNPPDIVKLGGWNIANYASKGLIAPVNPGALGYASQDAFAKAYAPGSLAALSHEDTVYGLPIDYNSLFLFYRRDHFEAAGLDPSKPPATWEQVAQYAQKLVQKNGDGSFKRAGFTYWYNLPIWDFLNFLPLIAGAGGNLVDGNEGGLGSDGGIKALTWFGDLSNKLAVASPKFTNPNNNYGQIADGSASMTVSANFAADLIPALGKVTLGKEFDVAVMPQWANAPKKVTSGYSWAWLVARRSKNADAAWRFLRFLQGTQAVAAQAKSGLLVPVKDWQNRPVTKGKKGAQIVSKEIPYTVYGPTLPKWSQMAQQLSDNMTALALGNKTPEQAASDYDSAMRRVLR